MSDVNQAFLRAYIKNRAAAAEPIANTPPNNPPSTRSLNATEVRMDAAHTQPQPLQPMPEVAGRNQHAARQGVWSPLGVERGFKATMETMSVPAVVRNGVQSVSPESTRRRVDQGHTRSSEMPMNLAPQAPSSIDRHPSMSAMPSAYESAASAPYVPTHDTAFPELTRQSRYTQTQTPSPFQPIAPEAPESHVDVQHRRFDTPSMRGAPLQGPHSKGAVQREAGRPPMEQRRGPAVDTRPMAPSAPQLNTPLPLPVAFAPSWEVDQFSWPEVVTRLEQSNADAFQQIGKHLSLANRDGLRVMAITSGERGVGRSTVAMHMARCAASAGLRVAVVDADPFSPSLVDQLRLEIEHGWQDCLFENVPLHEAAVHSIADRITLFPLTTAISHQQVHANLHRMSKLIKRISTAFDLVFLDANRLNLEQRDLLGVSNNESIIDAAIIVVDTELSIKEKVDTTVSILQSMGLSSIGLVENFQS